MLGLRKCLLTLLLLVAAQAGTVLVDTGCETYRGQAGQTSVEFLGIAFAEKPQRWKVTLFFATSSH